MENHHLDVIDALDKVEAQIRSVNEALEQIEKNLQTGSEKKSNAALANGNIPAAVFHRVGEGVTDIVGGLHNVGTGLINKVIGAQDVDQNQEVVNPLPAGVQAGVINRGK